MEKILAIIERIDSVIQRWLDNLQKRPWVVFLALSLVFGFWGWRAYFDERKASIAKEARNDALIKELTGLTINAQLGEISAKNDQIKTKDRLIDELMKNRTDTTSK